MFFSSKNIYSYRVETKIVPIRNGTISLFPFSSSFYSQAESRSSLINLSSVFNLRFPSIDSFASMSAPRSSALRSRLYCLGLK